MNQIALGPFFFAAIAQAQPAFDVISIRPVPPNAPAEMRSQDFTSILPGGQYVDSRATLHLMIAIAYQAPSWKQVIGLPGWAEERSFSVAAKPAPGFPALSPEENTEQVRLMMRAMLADRFHLQLHTETRREPAYSLEAAKGGVKLKEVDPPAPPDREGHVNAAYSDTDVRMIGRKSTMAGLAVALTVMLGSLVTDNTGLKGYYDIDERWTAPGAPGDDSGFGAEGIALVMSNLQSRFGLRLTRKTEPEEYWVVDHVDMPTPN